MSEPMPTCAQRLESVRAAIEALAPVQRPGARALAFGIDAIDTRLPAGGLTTGALHEVASQTSALADDGAATLFVAGIAARAGPQGMVLWLMDRLDLFAPALLQAGLPPSRLIQVHAPRREDVLAVMEDGLRHGGLAAVVGEVSRIGMTATRRLQLAAEEGRTTALLMRRWRVRTQDPLDEPSSATTRWRIGCAPSAPLPVAGVGRPRWNIALVRQRGGEPFDWLMEGCDAQGCLAVPAESRDRPAPPARRDGRQAA